MTITPQKMWYYLKNLSSYREKEQIKDQLNGILANSKVERSEALSGLIIVCNGVGENKEYFLPVRDCKGGARGNAYFVRLKDHDVSDGFGGVEGAQWSRNKIEGTKNSKVLRGGKVVTPTTDMETNQKGTSITSYMARGATFCGTVGTRPGEISSLGGYGV